MYIFLLLHLPGPCAKGHLIPGPVQLFCFLKWTEVSPNAHIFKMEDRGPVESADGAI